VGLLRAIRRVGVKSGRLPLRGPGRATVATPGTAFSRSQSNAGAERGLRFAFTARSRNICHGDFPTSARHDPTPIRPCRVKPRARRLDAIMSFARPACPFVSRQATGSCAPDGALHRPADSRMRGRFRRLIRASVGLARIVRPFLCPSACGGHSVLRREQWTAAAQPRPDNMLAVFALPVFNLE